MSFLAGWENDAIALDNKKNISNDEILSTLETPNNEVLKDISKYFKEKDYEALREELDAARKENPNDSAFFIAEFYIFVQEGYYKYKNYEIELNYEPEYIALIVKFKSLESFEKDEKELVRVLKDGFLKTSDIKVISKTIDLLGMLGGRHSKDWLCEMYQAKDIYPRYKKNSIGKSLEWAKDERYLKIKESEDKDFEIWVEFEYLKKDLEFYYYEKGIHIRVKKELDKLMSQIDKISNPYYREASLVYSELIKETMKRSIEKQQEIYGSSQE